MMVMSNPSHHQRTVQEQREADDKKYSGCDSKSHAAEEEPSRPNRPRNEKNRLRNSVPPQLL